MAASSLQTGIVKHKKINSHLPATFVLLQLLFDCSRHVQRWRAALLWFAWNEMCCCWFMTVILHYLWGVRFHLLTCGYKVFIFSENTKESQTNDGLQTLLVETATQPYLRMNETERGIFVSAIIKLSHTFSDAGNPSRTTCPWMCDGEWTIASRVLRQDVPLHACFVEKWKVMALLLQLTRWTGTRFSIYTFSALTGFYHKYWKHLLMKHLCYL